MAEGKRIFITGGTSGLGLEMVKQFIAAGYTVFFSGRDPGNIDFASNKLVFRKIDFGNLRQTAAEVKRLIDGGFRPDIIINNAGILGAREFHCTSDGFERTFQVNFLSHLVINDIFLSGLPAGGKVTLISVTSPVYRYLKPTFSFPQGDHFHSFRTYADTKYYNLLLGEWFRKKYAGTDLCFMGFDPGIFSSAIYRSRKRWFHSLYRIGAHFMTGSSVVAGSLVALVRDGNVSDRMVFRFTAGRFFPVPASTDQSDSFMLACEQAVRVVR